MILEKVNNQYDIKKLSLKEKKALAEEIREFLIDKVSKTGGHLASNLGVVEITIALLSCFDLDKDKVIFDVGHQSYVYKMFTGRREEFDNLRKYKGLRGFPYRKESKYDFFEAGHSSTSISAALGMARARDINKQEFNVVSLIGDGSISSGMSLEAINDLGYNKTKMIIILNDNGMSISTNVGGISSYLSRISINEKYLKVKNKFSHCLDDTKVGNASLKFMTRIKDGLRTFLVPSKYFETMGLTYIGPLDGHDIGLMTKVFNRAKKSNKPVIIHVVTKKGMGYLPAMEKPDIYHAVAPFDKEKGVTNTKKETYSTIFGKSMLKLASNKKLVAITAAMKDGVGLVDFFKKYPQRSFDVGISEEHAVTFAAGLASEGMIPIFAIYSTFLQRGFDQIIHDVCMQKLHVIFAIDRAGLVGADGETHQGIFDLSYLSLIPNLVITSPKTMEDLPILLEWSIKQNFPIAIRYPKGTDEIKLPKVKEISLGKWEKITKGTKNIAIIATGRMVQKAYLAKEKYNLDVTIINAQFIKPLDEKLLLKLINEKYNILTIEDNVLNGGLASLIILFLIKNNYTNKIITMGFDDKFIEQGSTEELFNQEHITLEEIKNNIKKLSN